MRQLEESFHLPERQSLSLFLSLSLSLSHSLSLFLTLSFSYVSYVLAFVMLRSWAANAHFAGPDYIVLHAPMAVSDFLLWVSCLVVRLSTLYEEECRAPVMFFSPF